MTVTALIPQVFYRDLAVGVDLFGDGIGMQVLHRDDELVVLALDHAKVYLCLDADPEPGRGPASRDRPELALEVDDIDERYADIARRRPDLLHPNLRQVTERPWGAREFALLDETTVCVVMRQW